VIFICQFEHIGGLLTRERPDHDLCRMRFVLGLVFGVQVNIGFGGADIFRAEDMLELVDYCGSDRGKRLRAYHEICP
jgi:hypothetical protein